MLYRGVEYYLCSCSCDRSGRRVSGAPKYWIPERYYSGRGWAEVHSPHFWRKRDVEREIRRLLRAGGQN